MCSNLVLHYPHQSTAAKLFQEEPGIRENQQQHSMQQYPQDLAVFSDTIGLQFERVSCLSR